MDRDFTLFVMPGLRAKLEAQAKAKRRTAKPGTIGSMNKAQLSELIKASLTRDVLAKRGAAKPDAKLQEIAKGLASDDLVRYLRFKGIQGMEGREALQLLLSMSAQERDDVLATLEKIQAAASEWNMVPADLIDLLK